MSIMSDAFTHGTLKEVGDLIGRLQAEGRAADYVVAYVRGYCEHWQKHDTMDPNAPRFAGPTDEEETLIEKRRRT